jgi:hypothetical protein
MERRLQDQQPILENLLKLSPGELLTSRTCIAHVISAQPKPLRNVSCMFDQVFHGSGRRDGLFALASAGKKGSLMTQTRKHLALLVLTF